MNCGRTPVVSKSPMTCPSGVMPFALEPENFLRRRDWTFHSRDLDDARDPSRSIRQSRHLDDQVERRRDLLAHRSIGQVCSCHQDHGFETRQCIARRVGVNRGHRALVTRVHRLEHVQRFAERTSPTMIRSGRIRSAFFTRSRAFTSPSPSAFGGRVSSRTTCSC